MRIKGLSDHPREVAEAALAHKVRSQIEAAYRRSDLTSAAFDGLPARDPCGGSDPPEGRGKWWAEGWTTYPCPVPHQRQKTGGRSLHFLPLLCGATPRRARRGQLKPAPHYALPQRIRGIRANSLPMRIPGHSLDHNGERLRPLREQRWGGQKRAPPDEPPPLFQWRMNTTARP